jgi:hypothetical protein
MRQLSERLDSRVHSLVCRHQRMSLICLVQCPISLRLDSHPMPRHPFIAHTNSPCQSVTFNCSSRAGISVSRETPATQRWISVSRETPAAITSRRAPLCGPSTRVPSWPCRAAPTRHSYERQSMHAMSPRGRLVHAGAFPTRSSNTRAIYCTSYPSTDPKGLVHNKLPRGDGECFDHRSRGGGARMIGRL